MLFCKKVSFLSQKGGGSEIPDDVHGAPGETCAEGGKDQAVALLEFVFVFVKTQGDRGSRGVAVFLDVDKHLVGNLYP